MSKFAIVNKMSDKLGKTGLKIKRYSPEILLVAGMVGTVVSAVMACKATTKVDDILAEAKENIDIIHKSSENPEMLEKYSKEEHSKALIVVYARTGLKLAELYAPAVTIGVLSLTSILCSHDILRKRNMAIAAAYATIDQTFKDYRKRVVDRFGNDVDFELRHNVQKQKIEEKVVDEQTGKEKKVKKEIQTIEDYSGYARFFDEASRYWEKDPELNLFFLRAEQNLANDRLKTRGYLFLNDVYERLDIPKTKAGQVVGWIYDPENPDHKGDNYVDFGIYSANHQKARDFVNGYERSIFLDFNVDGDILDQLETHQK